MKSERIFSTFYLPLVDENPLPKIPNEAWNIYFFHHFIVYPKDKNVIFYDLKQQKIDYIFNEGCIAFSRISENKIWLTDNENAYILNYQTKKVEEQCPIWFFSKIYNTKYFKVKISFIS